MGRLSGISGRQAAVAFCKLGYREDHQTGSHLILYCPGKVPLSVPQHKELAPGLLRGLIRRAGISVEEFLEVVQ